MCYKSRTIFNVQSKYWQSPSVFIWKENYSFVDYIEDIVECVEFDFVVHFSRQDSEPNDLVVSPYEQANQMKMAVTKRLGQISLVVCGEFYNPC